MKNSKKITLEELKERELGPYEWIDPSMVTGYDIQKEVKLNRWLATASLEEIDRYWDDDNSELPASDIISNYLSWCMRKRDAFISEGMPCPPELDITEDDFLKAALFLIVEFESNYPVVVLGGAYAYISHGIIDLHNAKKTLSLLKKEYAKKHHPHVKRYLRNFIAEIYLHDVCFTPETSPFSQALDADDIAFLNEISKNANPSR